MDRDTIKDIVRNDDKDVGARVKAFDHILFKEDVSTPLSTTMKTGTVIKRYSCYSLSIDSYYPDLVDIRMDYCRFSHLEGEERYMSRGHFTEGIQIVK